MSEEYQIIEPIRVAPTNFRHMIVVGLGASMEHAKADGDIIFGTEKQSLVISETGVYLNGELQIGITEECMTVIRKAICSVFGVTS